LPAKNLLEVPHNVTNEQAVFVEPLAAAIGITERVTLEPETKVAVIGDGKLGQLCARALKRVSSNTSLVGKHSSKLQLAKKRDIEVFQYDRCASLKSCFDVVIEVSGTGSGFTLAMDLVRPRGSIVLKSTFHGQPTWEAWRVVVDEISVVGSRCGKFVPALEALTKRQIDVEDLISEEYQLDRAVDALRVASTPGTMKVLLNME
jgi:threonine dehydrogenase-like Zn-dependent dehydrogenase